MEPSLLDKAMLDVRDRRLQSLARLLTSPDTGPAVLQASTAHGKTLLHMACWRLPSDVLDSLIDAALVNGCDIDRYDGKGATALHIACERGNYHAARSLILRGLADKEARRPNGATPLMLAALSGNAQLVSWLACVCERSLEWRDHQGRTALYIASQNGHSAVAEALIIAKAEIDAECKSGASPVVAASREGHAETVRLLMTLGASSNLLDHQGFTAGDRAESEEVKDRETLKELSQAIKEDQRRLSMIQEAPKPQEKVAYPVPEYHHPRSRQSSIHALPTVVERLAEAMMGFKNTMKMDGQAITMVELQVNLSLDSPFRHMCDWLCENNRKQFRRLDKDHSGHLSVAEVKQAIFRYAELFPQNFQELSRVQIGNLPTKEQAFLEQFAPIGQGMVEATKRWAETSKLLPGSSPGSVIPKESCARDASEPVKEVESREKLSERITALEHALLESQRDRDSWKQWALGLASGTIAQETPSATSHVIKLKPPPFTDQ